MLLELNKKLKKEINEKAKTGLFAPNVKDEVKKVRGFVKKYGSITKIQFMNLKKQME
jgi:hypothetical protein